MSEGINSPLISDIRHPTSEPVENDSTRGDIHESLTSTPA